MDLVTGIPELFDLRAYKMGFGVMHIEVVDHEDPAGAQALGDGADSVVVFPSGAEITEAGKKIKSVVVIVAAEGQPHIMHGELQPGGIDGGVLFRGAGGHRDAAVRDIDARHKISHRCEDTAVTAPAAGHVEHPAAGRRLQARYQFLDKGFRFLLIPFKI